mmetsp:Transcript_90691/g.210983  ORF Transcript_90691/g.210983 Transcript_90691/m.210983 type:complete len:410 (+) Transcript_90691:98-1327(+)
MGGCLCVLLTAFLPRAASDGLENARTNAFDQLADLLLASDQSIPPPRPWLPRVDCSQGEGSGHDYGFELQARKRAFESAVRSCKTEIDKDPVCLMRRAILLLRQVCKLRMEGAPVDGSTMPSSAGVLGLMSSFSHAELQRHAAHMRKPFKENEPFPNMVVDDFLPWPVFEKLDDEIPMLPVQVAAVYCAVGWLLCQLDLTWQWLKWTLPMTDKQELKAVESHMGPAARLVMDRLRSASFLHFLEQVTGIPDLLPDPLLWGGGIHQTASSGYLGLHRDFQEHPVYRGLRRRVNVFLYLSAWEGEDLGGDLELWQVNMNSPTMSPKLCRRKIRMKPNRAVIFEMSDSSFHGHPWPLRTAANQTRRSLALYYYTVDGSAAPTAAAVGDTLILKNLPCESEHDPQCYGEALLA